jgi:hypothetical protein
MDKEKIKEIFCDLLEAWEDSECTVIHDRGDIDDFEKLRMKKENYKKRFFEALND